ncbi:hypothetical protein GWI33_012766 [Rhynchophorus ferrugineus]|uniref:C2H2-type domain-containing protein n=1 Tax=Rhynchophorus ferrugineus TaxID=354439 RepID=A0A834MLT8_RHYFE|nr:hypothetical protein GWI33_012766 [Rhynchophorus ferrugineus]
MKIIIFEGNERFSCDYCGKDYNNLNTLRTHKYQDCRKFKTHVCSHCHTYFTRKYDMKKHIMKKHADSTLLTNTNVH